VLKAAGQASGAAAVAGDPSAWQPPASQARVRVPDAGTPAAEGPVPAPPPAPAPPALLTPAPGSGPAAQPAAWADTGILPASADQPPPEDPGLVKVSVPEARRLLRLATTPMTATARQAGYAWSHWRRKHQAGARWHHYQARLRAAPT
jgi:hypothetical protein